MKELRIYSREIAKRTGYKKRPYKRVKQISVFYDKKEFKNHYEKIDNPKLLIKFNCDLKTRSKTDIKSYIINNLGHSDSDKWLKTQLEIIIGE